MKLDANSFLFTDDHTGIVYLVRTKGGMPQIAEIKDEPASDANVAANSSSAANAPKACFSFIFLGLAGSLAGFV
jgi:hypothetical protein